MGGVGASVFITISFTKLIQLSIQTCLKLEPLEFCCCLVLVLYIEMLDIECHLLYSTKQNGFVSDIHVIIIININSHK